MRGIIFLLIIFLTPTIIFADTELSYENILITGKNIRIDNSIFNLHNKPPVPPVTETIKE